MMGETENKEVRTEGGGEVSFLDYLELILERRALVVKLTAAALLLSIALALALPKKYQAVARILPPQQDPGLMALMMSQAGGGLAGLAGNLLGTGTPADQYASMLQSERIKGTIVDRFHLMREYNQTYRADMYEKMDKLVEITAGKKDGIITIAVEDGEPEQAAAMANAYIDELGKLVAELSGSAAGINRTFLEQRLSRSRADLARAEDAMKAFQSRTRTINITEQAKASIEAAAALKAQLAAQEAQLSMLRNQFTDSSREVEGVAASVAYLKGQLARVEGDGSGAGAIPSLGSVPQLGQDQLRLLREFKTQEMLVELLTKQYELAKLTEAKDVTPMQVIQRAEVPDKKYKPKRRNLVLGVTFAGFVLSVSWVVLLSYLERMPAPERERWRRVCAMLRGRRREGTP